MDNPVCVIHEQALHTIMTKLDALANRQGELASNQAAMAVSLNSIQREVETGFAAVIKRQDLTNGRVTTLEGKVGRLEVDAAAQEAFTPGIFRSLEELGREKSDAHGRIWAAIEALKAANVADHEREARESGWRGGAAKVGALAWCALLALIAAVAWLVEQVMTHAAGK